LAQADPARVAINKRMADADRKGDLKGVRAAVTDSLNGPHPIFDWLHTVDVPDRLKGDLSAYLSSDEGVRSADQAYARAQTDQQLSDAQHGRNVALRIAENATNQFRVDLGMTPFPCPYSGP